MKKSPVTIVKERFQNKEGLVAAVRDLATDELWIDRLHVTKGLERVSNAKLLHLHELLTSVKAKFGNRSGMVDRILEVEKRVKDDGYRARLERFSTPRLWDLVKSVEGRKPAAN